MATQLAPGQKVKGYTIETLIQDGGRSFAYKARDSHGTPVFLKQFKSPIPRKKDLYKPFIAYQEQLKKRFESELLADKVYKSIEYFEFDATGSGSPTRNNYYQAFEFITSGCDLCKYLENSRTAWAQRIIFSKLLMFAMSKFHEANIVHCDLKPDNLYLIEDKSIKSGFKFKVIDFDFTFMTDVNPPWIGAGEGYGGTPNYFSPEHILAQHDTAYKPIPASDVFTCGLILYELLAKSGHPYRTDDEEEYNRMVLEYKAPIPLLRDTTGNPERDKAIAEILHRCLDPKASNRPTAKEVQQCIIHNASSVSKTLPPPDSSTDRRIPEPKTGSHPEDFEKPPTDRRASHATSTSPHVPTTAKAITLESENGAAYSYKIDTVFGKAQALRFSDDGRFFSDAQFSFERVGSDWFAAPCGNTTNESIYNGTLLSDRVKLKDGDTLAVGRLSKGVIKLPLKIRIG